MCTRRYTYTILEIWKIHRYTSFNCDDVDKAQAIMKDLLGDAQQTIDKTRDTILRRVIKSLDPDRMWFMGTVGNMDTFDLSPFDPERKGLYELGYQQLSEEELRQLARDLIDLNLLRGEDAGPMEKRICGASSEYRVTVLGKAVWVKLPEWCKQNL